MLALSHFKDLFKSKTYLLEHADTLQPHLLCPLCHYPTDRHDPHTGCPHIHLTQTQLPLVYAEYLRTNTTPFARLGIG